jgi:MFS family permease
VLLLSAIPGAMAMAALVFGVREDRRELADKPREAAAPVDDATRRSLARYLVAVVLFGLGNSSDAFLLLRAQQCGVAVRWIPLLWMAHNATKAALSTWAGALSDRIGRRTVILAGWILYAAVYLAFGFATHAWQIWALFVAYGVYYSLTEGAGKALVADLAPAHARGRAFGWYNFAVGIVALPSSLAFGALADRFGARVPFTASAALALAASLWLALWVRLPSSTAATAPSAR